MLHYIRGDYVFERARNEENKKIRLDEIKNAAIDLFDTNPYHDITISKIAKQINFTRANLYKYIKSKEDVYLFIFMDEINNVVSDLEERLITNEVINAKSFTKIWAEVLFNHPRFLKLYTLLFSIIEQNCDMDVLVSLKKTMPIIFTRLVKTITHNLKDFSDEECFKLLDYSMSFMISRYYSCNPTPKQLEATKLSQIDYVFPDFVETSSDGMLLLINGIRVSKLQK